MRLPLSLFMLALLTACTQTIHSPAPLHQAFDWISDGTFTQGVEGPAYHQGNLYAVNFAKEGTIGVVSEQNQASLYVTLPVGSTGNGIRFNRSNEMFIADYSGHNVLKVDSQAKVSVYAHQPTMNQPNDLAIMDNGILFASDPNWQHSTGKLWRINLDGSTTLLNENMGTTNGIEVSPDNQTLYVNESVQRRVWAFSLDPHGNIGPARLFHQFADFGLDGMRTDKQGNLYIARYGAGEIAVLNPQGQLIRQIKLTGQHPTNVAFGGKDGKQVFVTMQKRGAIETFYNDIAGREF
ncbi:SMP-30/gluconolactonase/LRE family protein [Pseudoalteromonas fenneropenaei]|uniref:SMP-30/gluconolactonase/LRE family protein n=1 Tax=Pseudoalteromonas fenneropenaei TaxID=1737459 RepID=A0ABV7CG77_9GAMM